MTDTYFRQRFYYSHVKEYVLMYTCGFFVVVVCLFVCLFVCCFFRVANYSNDEFRPHFKVASSRSEKPICAPPGLSELLPVLPLMYNRTLVGKTKMSYSVLEED